MLLVQVCNKYTGYLLIEIFKRNPKLGRTGQAYSLVASDEVSYMVDLNLFLGSDVKMYQPTDNSQPDSNVPYYGCIPQDVLDAELGWVKSQVSRSVELVFIIIVIFILHHSYPSNNHTSKDLSEQ